MDTGQRIGAIVIAVALAVAIGSVLANRFQGRRNTANQINSPTTSPSAEQVRSVGQNAPPAQPSDPTGTSSASPTTSPQTDASPSPTTSPQTGATPTIPPATSTTPATIEVTPSPRPVTPASPVPGLW